MRRPDPRDPLVIDIRELGRRPGAMREIVREAPAPADLGIAVIAIPEGTPVHLALKLESVVEGVLVSGTATTSARGECVRCLDSVTLPVVVDVQELFDYPDVHGKAQVATEEDGEHETRQIVDDLIELEPLLRDLAVLALPLKPLCGEDCPGLCSQCGANLAEDPQHGHDDIDPRWAELASLNVQSASDPSASDPSASDPSASDPSDSDPLTTTKEGS